MPNSIIIIWFGYIGGTGDDLIYGRDGQDCLQGGAGDAVQFSTTTHDHIHFQRGGNDLYVFTDDDIADGAVNHGVVLQGYFLGTAGIEWVVDQNGAGWQIG